MEIAEGRGRALPAQALKGIAAGPPDDQAGDRRGQHGHPQPAHQLAPGLGHEQVAVQLMDHAAQFRARVGQVQNLAGGRVDPGGELGRAGIIPGRLADYGDRGLGTLRHAQLDRDGAGAEGGAGGV